MSVDDLDLDILGMFKDQLYTDLSRMKKQINDLENLENYADAVNALFRVFHNYKATTRYLNFLNFHELATHVENVLEVLRTQSSPVNESIIKWLFRVKEQLTVWSDELEENAMTLSSMDYELINELTIEQASPTPSTMLKSLSLVYLDSKSTRAKKLIPALKNTLKEAHYFDDINLLLKRSEAPNIVLINLGDATIATAKQIQDTFAKTGIIAVVDNLTRENVLALSKANLDYTLANPINGKTLKRELTKLSAARFSRKRLIISNTKIMAFIKSLKPLPNSLFQIQQICDDEEMAINDLIKVVQTDPIMSGAILNAAASPIYGLKKDITINRAISSFGKQTVKALVLSEMSNALGEIDLSPYNINESTFSEVASKRLQLMMKWYSKVSVAALSILSSSAILGNLGQILIAQEVMQNRLKDDFEHLIDLHNINYAEEQLLHTSTARISGSIIKFWKLQPEIVESIYYSDCPDKAPIESYEYALANHIVFSLIALDGSMPETIPEHIKEFLLQEGLELAPLEKAFNVLR